MEYKKRGGVVNFGVDYETNITALYAIRSALDGGIDDVLMASNAGDYGAFDDIVLRIRYKNGTNELLAIQIKHKSNGQKRVDFVNKKNGDFSLDKYKDSYLKEISTKLLESEDHLSKDLRPNDIVLCLFTNANMCENTSNILLNGRTSLSCTAIPRKSSADFANTSSDEYHTFEMHKKPPDFVRFLRCYLFRCNQRSYEDTVRIITANIGEEIEPSVVKNICNSFKNELKTKLKCDGQINFYDALTRSADVVKKSLGKFDLQLLEKTLADISEYFRKEYDSALTTYDDLPSQSEEYTRFFGRFRFYSRQLENAEVIEAITLRIKRSFGEVQADVPRKFLDYIRSYVQGDHLLTKHQIKSKLLELILPSGEDLQRKMEIFRNVTDLSDPEQRLEVLAHLEVCIQGKESVRLSDVVDASFCHDLTPEFLLRNAGGTIRVGTKLELNCENYIRRKFFKVLLKQEILWHTNDYIYILDARLERNVMNQLKVIDLTNGGQELPKQTTKENYVVLISKDDDVDGRARKLAQIKPNRVHYLKVRGCYLEWEKSWGSTAELNQFVVKDETVEEDELLRYFRRTVNVISAVPGMGKSTVLDALARYCSSDRWVLRINLNEYNEDLCDRLRDVLSDPLGYFYERIEPPDDLSRRVFRNLKSRKAITVLIDAFDEISPRYTYGVLELIAKLDRLGVHTWITTRPNAEPYIQERLHLMPVDIQGISNDDVAQFLGTRGFSRVHPPIDFFQIPLHLNMLTTISSKQELRWQDLQETDLYDHFVSSKCSIYYEKFGINVKRNHVRTMVAEVDELIRAHQVLALILIYGGQFLDEHGITSPSETKGLVQDILGCKNHLGLVTTVIDEVPIFSHRTYAEYLAAKWLSSNLNHAAFKRMYAILFEPSYQVVRFMFDKLITRTHSLHAAIVNENLELVREICSQEPGPMVRDQLDRTPLHLCASHFNNVKVVIHASNRVICQVMDEIVRSFSSKTESFFQELDVLGWDWQRYAIMTGNCNLFHIACYWGCKHILLHLPGKAMNKFWIEWTSPGYQSIPYSYNAIKYIVSGGQVDLLNLLLECEIYTNIENLAFFAIQYRQADVLKMLMARGVKLEGIQRVWLKYLQTAFIHRLSAFVDMLGTVVDVNARSKDGISAMHVAAKLGLVEYLEVLTSKGAHVDIADRWNKTPLGAALEYKQTECVNFLNDFRKQLIQTCDDDFESCEERLGLASIRHILGDAERKDVARRMLLSGCTPLRAASSGGYLSALKEMMNLFGGANAFAGDDSSTLLQWAVRGRHLDVAEWLIGAGADVNHADECGFTTLHVALANFTLGKDGVGDFGLEMLELLVSKGADVHVNREDQDTYLNVAIKLGSLEAVRFLLDCGVDPNAASKCNGNVPLFLAVLWNCFDKLFRSFGSYEEFVMHFCDISHASFWFESEYFLRILSYYGSAFTGNLNMVRQLIGKGADVNVTDVNMNTPLFCVVRSGDLGFAKVLVRNGADAVRKNVHGQSCFGMAVKLESWEMVQLFVHNGIPADHRNSGKEYTALHRAIVTKRYDIVKYLLGKGAKVNAKVGKQTCLDLALERHMYNEHNWKAIKILVENGADVNSKRNSKRNTPLHCAVEEDRQDIVEYLVEKGADATIRNGFNKLTALELARDLKRTHMESYLRRKKLKTIDALKKIFKSKP